MSNYSNYSLSQENENAKKTTHYSLGEIDSLSRKATRGAGYSWGMAEEAGKAVRWLSAYGLAGAESLAKHLQLVANNQQNYIPRSRNVTSNEFIFENDAGSLCSLYSGALINDLGHHLDAKKTLIFKNISSPLLAIPSAGRIAETYNISVSLVFSDQTVICNPDGITVNNSSPEQSQSNTPPHFESFPIDAKVDLICNLADGVIKSTHFPSPQSRHIEPESLLFLENFAQKTYAPATEESRLRGAG